MAIAFMFIHFAFEGNPGTQSGPAALLSSLSKLQVEDPNFRDLVSSADYFEYRLKFNETPENFLRRVEGSLLEMFKVYEFVIAFGGNHLSVMPFYNYFYATPKSLILTYDAHRDYYKQTSINHATFLKHLGPKAGFVQHYIVGFRDKNDEPCPLGINGLVRCLDFKNKLFLSDDASLQSVFIDVDVDVFDSSEFDCACDILEGGLLRRYFFDNLASIPLEKLRCLTISEYIPYRDNDMKGSQFLISIIKSILLLRNAKNL